MGGLLSNAVPEQKKQVDRTTIIQRYDLEKVFVRAAALGDEKIVATLTKYVDVNCCAGYDGRTALMEAAYGGHMSVVRDLVLKGANIDKPCAVWGRTALMWAVARNHENIYTHLMLEHADVHACDCMGHTALMIAAHAGALNAIALLLELGADPNVQDLGGDDALAHSSDPGAIDILVSHGATRVNEALFVHAMEGHESIVRKLCSLPGVDVNFQLQHRYRDVRAGATPLLVAVRALQTSVVRYLLHEAHADFDARDSDGYGVYSYAIESPISVWVAGATRSELTKMYTFLKCYVFSRPLYNLLMGDHKPRHVLFSHKLFDRNVIHLIFSFLRYQNKAPAAEDR